ncbi:hypothetical protein vBValMR10Z_337 [Vibrio phage vB_ValM_R10Z]|nr:hypothetical protein vBValMR10Z_337 [Vibrio phage vB_ValM_R10Z]URQ03425.1 hypothetical protein PVA23_48 [Vibrio phage PVA23]
MSFKTRVQIWRVSRSIVMFTYNLLVAVSRSF